jgi:PHD/YefM family antitoxin component YafN of YafNO toxin-antitoxin module
MGEPAAPMPSRSLELSVPEARSRFVQLVRFADLTHQITTVTDGGRPVAVIAPAGALRADENRRDDRSGGSRTAEGWLRRIEQVRTEVRRQHERRIAELEQAVEQLWRALDDVQPPRTNSDVDALRVLHGEIRRPPA